MYKRTLEQAIKAANQSFPVLMITGPRQVGKTTLLEVCSNNERAYVTLDDLEQRRLAQEDPALFIQTHKPPVTIDEVQYAPQLFSYIKMSVDKSRQNGMYWLTGSQKFHLMKGVTESLAGRVAILDLLGFSQAEIQKRPDCSTPFLPSEDWLSQVNEKVVKATCDIKSIYQRIWTGAFPKLYQEKNISRDVFYNSYVQTYIQRDVRDILNISNELAFKKFLSAIAARTGQLLNFSDLARDVDIDHKTAKSWLSVLEASGLVYLLQPYYQNTTKRLVKTPKLYFLDTGLCSYLTRWSTPESLEAGAMTGAILETYIFSELLKSYWHNARIPHFYYYRDLDQKEIDLIIDVDNKLYPVEFKKTASPSKSAAKHFHSLKKFNKAVGHGAVICLTDKVFPISQEVSAIPVGCL